MSDETRESETLTTAALLDRIAETLYQADGEWIAKIANSVLSEKVTFVGNEGGFRKFKVEYKP